MAEHMRDDAAEASFIYDRVTVEIEPKGEGEQATDTVARVERALAELALIDTADPELTDAIAVIERWHHRHAATSSTGARPIYIEAGGDQRAQGEHAITLSVAKLTAVVDGWSLQEQGAGASRTTVDAHVVGVKAQPTR